MYCSSCGSAVPNQLTFCNKCGAKLINDPLAGPKPELLVAGICGLFIMGTGVIVGLMAVLKEVVKTNEGVVLAAGFVCFSVLLLIEIMLSWMLISTWRSSRKGNQPLRLEERATNELNEATPRMLHEPLVSVTEHTTRAFEPIYTERK